MRSLKAAQALRSLRSVSAQLRQLADDPLCQGDRSLYLMAAEALETRAQRLAAALPEELPDKTVELQLPQPINVII
jgi:hypothetical protein